MSTLQQTLDQLRRSGQIKPALVQQIVDAARADAAIDEVTQPTPVDAADTALIAIPMSRPVVVGDALDVATTLARADSGLRGRLLVDVDNATLARYLAMAEAIIVEYSTPEEDAS